MSECDSQQTCATERADRSRSTSEGSSYRIWGTASLLPAHHGLIVSVVIFQSDEEGRRLLRLGLDTLSDTNDTIVRTGDRLLFYADDGRRGLELWALAVPGS